MEIVEGMIVKSIAGRDKNSFYVVYEVKDEFVKIVDGKKRKLAKLKAKNLKHVRKTNKIVNLKELKTDKSIRKCLSEYNSN